MTVEISRHRETRRRGMQLLGDRLLSFKAVEAMRSIGVDALA
ncbi:hypothetical protein [Sphingobium sp. RAC03]|nr:hypothetical protein [Sphingobium sp. RAC03]